MTDGTAQHPTALELAALADTDAANRRALDRHVAGCPSCWDQVERLRQVRLRLAALPRPTLPPDVAARTDAALAAAAAETPSTSRRRRWRPGSAVAAAAALVVVVLGGTTLLLRDGGGRANRATSSGLSASRQTAAPTGGRDYRPDALAAQVRRLVAAPPRGTIAGPDAAPGAVPMRTAAVELAGCLRAIGAGVRRPLAVDSGTFLGRPAVVIVLPHGSHPSQVDVVAVGPTCSDASPDVRYRRIGLRIR